MDRSLTFLNQNWVGVLLAIIALIYALYEGLKKRGPRLAYQYVGQRIIGRSIDLLPDRLSVEYDGKPVENLSLTRVVIWNKGRAAIRGTDVPADDRIVLSFQDGRIIRVELSKSTREINKSRVNIENREASTAVFDFDFLDVSDGALVSIWHTSEKTMPTICGTIIGQTSGIESFGRFMWRGREPLKTNATFGDRILRDVDSIVGLPYSMPAVIIFMGIVIASSAMLDYYLGIRILRPSATPGDFEKFWFPLGFGAVNIVLGVWSARRLLRRFPKKLLPEDFVAKEEKVLD